MTITLELTDEQAHRLRARAAKRGQSVEEYLLSLSEREPLPYAEWKTRLEALPRLLGKKLPPLPEEAFSRETMYRE